MCGKLLTPFATSDTIFPMICNTLLMLFPYTPSLLDAPHQSEQVSMEDFLNIWWPPQRHHKHINMCTYSDESSCQHSVLWLRTVSECNSLVCIAYISTISPKHTEMQCTSCHPALSIRECARSGRSGQYPDEHYVPTFLSYMGLENETVCNGALVTTKWEGGAHPKSFAVGDINVKLCAPSFSMPSRTLWMTSICM